jgi:hypothetical protein
MVAVAGAQAADLPMKAKAPAVQYVKICSLYGAGFYYIPGTDTCLKIGGYIRTQVESQSAGGGVITGSSGGAGAAVIGASPGSQGLQNRVDSNDIQYRLRAVITFDTRTQGEYGTLRNYIRVGWESTTPTTSAAGTAAGSAYWDRAFIQFAGFTVGKAQSFFDVYSYGGSRSYLNVRTSGDTGAAGLMLWAYTAQFGNGFSATLSLEDPRGHNLYGVRERTAAAGGFSIGGLDNGLSSSTGAGGVAQLGWQVPDIVGNLRVDQAWGFFGVSAALHQVAGGYYTTSLAGCIANTVGCGHPEDKWGWAVGVGGQLNVPGLPGDTMGAMFRWAQGATGYTLAGGVNLGFIQGNTVTASVGADAIFAAPGLIPGANGALQLVEAWSINAHYEHLWTRALRTSVYGGYGEVQFPGGAKRVVCGGPCGGLSPDYSIWLVGSRTQWSPWAGQLNIGVDVVYASYQTARPLAGPIPAGVVGAQNLAGKVFGDTDNVSVMFRVQRNWFP